MQRFAVIAALLLPCAFAQAQTSIKITMPDTSSCTYHTGQISSNSTPGQLQASATDTGTSGGTGTGCGVTNVTPPVTFGPASPLVPNAVTLASSASGETTSFSFQALNATTCTGSIVGTGGVFTPAGTNTVTFCSPTTTLCSIAQSVSTLFPYNSSTTASASYTVKASCTGPGSAVPVVSQAAVTVSADTGGGGGGGACAKAVPNSAGGSFAALGGTVTVAYSGHPSAQVNITDFDSIYQGTTWPASYNRIAIFTLQNGKYISAAFTPASNYFTASNIPNGGVYGQLSIAGTFYSAPISMTISTACGDFTPPGPGSTVVPGCYLNSGNSSGGLVQWEGPGTGHSCVLTGNTPYFLNIINADIGNLTPSGGTATSTCTSTSCTNPISNGPGNWLGYTPH